MYTSSHGNPKHAPAGHPTAPMNLPPPSHVSPFRGSAASASSWSTGLCHCCDDPANCLITAFCPCVTFGQISVRLAHFVKSIGSSRTVALIWGLSIPLSLVIFTFTMLKFRSIFRPTLKIPC
ncbi:hypothetical protein GOBAR_DD06126 [Gossypium barbadense]|nr:hypothetical protein GOBAR_DD06126 [Gossypium barbadense]